MKRNYFPQNKAEEGQVQWFYQSTDSRQIWPKLGISKSHALKLCMVTAPEPSIISESVCLIIGS